MRRIRDNSRYLNRLNRRDDVKDSVKNVLGNIFHWPTALSVPTVPTVALSTSKIEETPIAIEADDLDTLEVPAVPTVTPGATVYTYTDDGECTISIASPAEITLAGHGLAANHEVYFKTSGALPTGIVQYTHYYVKSPAEDTFNISAAAGGAAINTSGSQSGTHKLWTKD